MHSVDLNASTQTVLDQCPTEIQFIMGMKYALIAELQTE